MTTTEPTPDQTRAAQKRERAALKKAASRLGWKLVGRETVEIRIERAFTFGGRTAIVRGRVAVATPGEMTAAEGERLLAPVVDPAVGAFQHALERAATKILSAPDDAQRRHVYEHSSFFSALEEARRGLVREYQELGIAASTSASRRTSACASISNV